MASIREVAKLAHVAPSTVSRALNGSGYVSEKSKNKKAVEELDLFLISGSEICIRKERVLSVL